MAGDLVVCLDLGTTRIKGGAFAPDGTMVTSAAAPVPPLENWRGFLSFNPPAYREAALRVLAETAGGLDDPGRVRGLALTNQRATVVPAREDGTPAGPALSWQDTSGDARLAAFLTGFGAERFSAITGLPPSALWSLGKILRLREAAPEVFAAADRIVLLHDYILRSLGAGEFLADASNASATGLLDLSQRAWSGELLRAAGLSPARLPRLVPPGSPAGTLSPAAARAAGLEAGIPLIVGGGDQQCAALGIGALDPGEVALSLGTAAVLSCPVGEPGAGAAGRFFCTAHILPGRWVLEGIHNAFAASIQWAVSALGLSSLGAIEEALKKSPPGSDGVRFLPFLSGIGTPDYQASAAGTFLGLRPTHTPADLMRSVCEGVLLETRRLIDAAREETDLRRLLAGGGFTAGGFGQLLADVLGRELAVTGAAEVSLLGAAALAWTGIGGFENAADAGRRLAARGCRTLAPLAENNYDAVYAGYLRDVEAGKTLYREREL